MKLFSLILKLLLRSLLNCLLKFVWYLLLTYTDDLLAFVSLHVLINLELLYCLSCIWSEATGLLLKAIVSWINVPINIKSIFQSFKGLSIYIKENFPLRSVITSFMTSKIRIEDAFSNYTCFYVDEFMWQQKIVSNLKAGDKHSNNKNKTWDDCFSYSNTTTTWKFFHQIFL